MINVTIAGKGDAGPPAVRFILTADSHWRKKKVCQNERVTYLGSGLAGSIATA